MGKAERRRRRSMLNAIINIILPINTYTCMHKNMHMYNDVCNVFMCIHAVHSCTFCFQMGASSRLINFFSTN